MEPRKDAATGLDARLEQIVNEPHRERAHLERRGSLLSSSLASPSLHASFPLCSRPADGRSTPRGENTDVVPPRLFFFGPVNAFTNLRSARVYGHAWTRESDAPTDIRETDGTARREISVNREEIASRRRERWDRFYFRRPTSRWTSVACELDSMVRGREAFGGFGTSSSEREFKRLFDVRASSRKL